MTGDRLHRAVIGDDRDDVPRVLLLTWQAIVLRLDMVPAGRWQDRHELVLDVAAFVDCAPALVSELLHAAAELGAIERRRFDGVRCIRKAQTTGRNRGRHPREETHHDR